MIKTFNCDIRLYNHSRRQTAWRLVESLCSSQLPLIHCAFLGLCVLCDMISQLHCSSSFNLFTFVYYWTAWRVMIVSPHISALPRMIFLAYCYNQPVLCCMAWHAMRFLEWYWGCFDAIYMDSVNTHKALCSLLVRFVPLCELVTCQKVFKLPFSSSQNRTKTDTSHCSMWAAILPVFVHDHAVLCGQGLCLWNLSLAGEPRASWPSLLIAASLCSLM